MFYLGFVFRVGESKFWVGGKGKKARLPYFPYFLVLPCTPFVLPSYSLRTPSVLPRTPFVLPLTPFVLPRTSFVLPSYSLVLPRTPSYFLVLPRTPLYSLVLPCTPFVLPCYFLGTPSYFLILPCTSGYSLVLPRTSFVLPSYFRSTEVSLFSPWWAAPTRTIPKYTVAVYFRVGESKFRVAAAHPAHPVDKSLKRILSFISY